MEIINSKSLYKTLDNLNHIFINKESISVKDRTEVAHWIAARQGLKVSYTNMPAPTEADFKGIRLFTGDILTSKASIGHILGEESIRALYLLDIKDQKTSIALSNASSGIKTVIERNYKAGNYYLGTFCCGKCTAALWRNLSAEGVKKNKEYFESGIKYLKSLRDGKDKWKRFPFFYTVLALSDIDLPESKSELEYASVLLKRYVNRKGRNGIYENRKKAISKKALELIG